MSSDKKLILALDTSHEHGIVALLSHDAVLAHKALTDKMSHGTAIIGAIEEVLAGVEPRQLAGLMVGLGPGSFVGLRIALATALGFALGRSLPLMGFCSHQAIEASYPSVPEPRYIIMKASGSLCYVSLHGLIEVKELEQALEEIPAGSRVISDLVLSTDVIACQGPSAEGMLRVVKNRLSGGLIDESQLIKPNYIKAPNVSLPKKSPVIAVFQHK